jgi:hypothetical protein
MYIYLVDMECLGMAGSEVHCPNPVTNGSLAVGFKDMLSSPLKLIFWEDSAILANPPAVLTGSVTGIESGSTVITVLPDTSFSTIFDVLAKLVV